MRKFILLGKVIYFTLFCPLKIFATSQEYKPYTLESVAEAYCLAQTAIWLDETTIAIGRWDGCITIFSYDEKLRIMQGLVPPHKAPITALEKIDDHCFISSDGPSALVWWTKNENGYQLHKVYHFDEHYGSVDSALFIQEPDNSKLITGHSNGYIVVWNCMDTELQLTSTMNLRSIEPLASPYQMWNIRRIILWENGTVITASEDGNLSIVDYLNNQLLHQQKYNQNAKRGINDIAIAGNFLLLSNCSVGPYDKNLWLYKVENHAFTYLDSINLVADKSKRQVFSFSVGLLTGEQNDYFMCSTGESLLWYGIIKEDRFGEFCFAENSLKGGAALAIHPTQKYCVSVNYDVKILKIDFDNQPVDHFQGERKDHSLADSYRFRIEDVLDTFTN